MRLFPRCCARSRDEYQARSAAAAEDGQLWSYVGQKNGSYEPEMTYQWVGEGNGSFGKTDEVVPVSYKPKPWCLGCMSVLVIGLVSWSLWHLGFLGNAIAGGSSSNSSKATTAGQEPFDCSDATQWQVRWSKPQKEYCCKKYGRGCEGGGVQPTREQELGFVITTPNPATVGAQAGVSTAAPAVATPAALDIQFDCNAALEHWKTEWAIAKQVSCCRHESKGCLYDCSEDAEDWLIRWPTSQQEWCCSYNGGVGDGCRGR